MPRPMLMMHPDVCAGFPWAKVIRSGGSREMEASRCPHSESRNHPSRNTFWLNSTQSREVGHASQLAGQRQVQHSSAVRGGEIGEAGWIAGINTGTSNGRCEVRAVERCCSAVADRVISCTPRVSGDHKHLPQRIFFVRSQEELLVVQM